MENISNNKQPALFIAHGSPMNAIEKNAFTEILLKTGKSLKRRPDAILMISAHWQTFGTFVNSGENPGMIYDFGGFPKELYEVDYPAQGSPETAKKVLDSVPDVKETKNRGYDHGAWSVLKHLFPEADIPVAQLSIDHNKSLEEHYEMAKKLRPLRENNILIIGSGNIVHALQMPFRKEPYDWAVEFDDWVKTQIMERNFDNLINFEKAGKSSEYSVPTLEHYIPLLYILAQAEENEPLSFIYEGMDLGIVSMRSIKVGN